MDREIPSKISSAPNDFDRFFAVINDMVDSIPFENSLMNWNDLRAITRWKNYGELSDKQ
jgi:hypothetical protein